MKRIVLAVIALCTLAMPVVAVIETYEFSTPQLQERYRALSQELRCPKCQNQNIADSNAPISQDLRRLLFQQLEAGASDEEILDFMEARYGEFVRYRPKLSGATALLWLAPLLLLIAALVLLVLIFRGSASRGAAQETQLSEEERQRLARLVEDADDEVRRP